MKSSRGLQFFPNGLQPHTGCTREMQNRHGDPIRVVDGKHLKVLLRERDPEAGIISREWWEGEIGGVGTQSR
jgi:hypothetical protein